MLKKGKILAIDYGTKKIGLAVSDDARLLAFGRGILDRSEGFAKNLKKIQKLCNSEHVQELVFGLALDDQGEEGETAKKVRNFAKKLEPYFVGLSMHFIDESFSSFEAKNMQKEVGNYGHDDEMAAIVILQRYLDSIV